MRTSSLLALLAVGLLFGFAACKTSPDADGTSEGASGLTPVQFPDIPVPEGMTLRTQLNESHSYEAGHFRFGDFYYYGNNEPDQVRGYMTERMGLHGWLLESERSQEGGVTELVFVRHPHRVRCSVWVDSKDLTQMHVEVRTDAPSMDTRSEG